MSQSRTVFLLGLLTAVAAVLVLFLGPEFAVMRAAVGIPFVLLLPGQAVMLYVDPDGRLGGLESFALSIATSISLVALLGMALAVSPWQLTAEGMVVAIACATLLMLVFSRVRAVRQPPKIPNAARRSLVQRMPAAALGVLGCAIAVLLLSVPIPSSSNGAGTVQLWALPEAGSIRMGANNVDAKSRQYTLTIQQAGRPISEQQLDLPPGSSRIFVVTQSATWTNSAPVTAVLTDQTGSISPRSISVWMTQ